MHDGRGLSARKMTERYVYHIYIAARDRVREHELRVLLSLRLQGCFSRA